MRLTLATAVVASRTAAVSSAEENAREATASTTTTSFVDYDQEEKRRQLLHVGNGNVGSSQTAWKQSLLPNHGKRRQEEGDVDPSFPTTNGILNKLKNSAAEDDDVDKDATSKECYPSVDHTNGHNSHQDVLGVLSCGLKKYCQESEGSSLGGFCVDKTNHETKSNDDETKLKNNPYPQQLVRRRQQVVGRLTVLQLADLFCNRPDATELTVDCDCSNMDFENGNGTLSCYFGPDCIDLDTGCEDDGSGGLVYGGGSSDLARNGDTFEHCTTEKFDANITSETFYEYTSCYTQRMPRTDYSFTYCTDFAFNVFDGPTCDIEVEGERCNSCGIAIGGGVDYAENCEVFGKFGFHQTTSSWSSLLAPPWTCG